MEKDKINKEVQEFVTLFFEKHGRLVTRVAKKYIIPNRYTVDDLRQYIAERIVKIMTSRLGDKTNLINNPEKYFKSCLDFYCIEYQRMHGYIFELPKRPRKNCEEDEASARAYGFKYLGDITTQEYNSLQYNCKQVEETEEGTHTPWFYLTGCLTEGEAQVIECIYTKEMTWADTSKHLGVAQSTCWFRKNKAIKKITTMFNNLSGDLQENLTSFLRNNAKIIEEIKNETGNTD